MIYFNEKTILSKEFDHADYLKFLDEEAISKKQWYGISIQSKSQNSYEGFVKLFQDFTRLIDPNKSWIITHDDKRLPWFLSMDEMRLFPKLLSHFQDFNMAHDSIGEIVCNTIELNSLAQEILCYPNVLSYKNLDCICESAGIIMKTTSHITLDLIVTKEEYLDAFYPLITDEFVVKRYRDSV